MSLPTNKKDIDILEERGLWEASSVLYGRVKKLTDKDLPVEIGHIKDAHRILFTVARSLGIAGKYRQHNGPELKRIDGSILPMLDWHLLPNAMAELDMELRERTKNLKYPKSREDYDGIIFIASHLSHKLASIHPFENGNGRVSRLLINAILLRVGLPEIAIKKSKPVYLRAMLQADYGDFSLLEDLITQGLIDAQKKTFNTLQQKQAELAKVKIGKK